MSTSTHKKMESNTNSNDATEAEQAYINILNKYGLYTLGEALFIVLPLVVITYVSLTTQSFYSLIASPEWSFAATVLFGQSLFRITMAVAILPRSTNWQYIGFLVAVILVFGIVPSLLNLSYLLNNPNPPWAIVLLQLVLFIVGFVVFIFLNTSGHIMATREAEDRGTRWLLSELKPYEKEGDIGRKLEEVRSKIGRAGKSDA